MYEINHEWLSRRSEVAEEPEIEIVDSHHHLIREDYNLEQFYADAVCGHRISHTVVIACGQSGRKDGPPELRSVGETEFLVEEAGRGRDIKGPEIAGIVANCDLSAGNEVDLGNILSSHLAAGGGLLRAFRANAAHEPSGSLEWAPVRSSPPTHAGALLTPEFRGGLRLLSQFETILELWIYYLQLSELELVLRDVDIPVVIDHMGAPLGAGIYATDRENVLREWRAGMSALSRHDNVYVKLSGLGLPILNGNLDAGSKPPSSDDLVAFWGESIDFLIGTFGPKRCMFGSDFPADKTSCSYTTVWNAHKKMTRTLSSEDRERLFVGTASDLYDIGA